ncbi:MAG: DMT family transporter [Planctomycetes bacterium]|nr:DMT family transporter [Planctomycetota bacterium]
MSDAGTLWGMSDAGIGQLCALLTAVTWASSMVLFKRSGETIPPLALNAFKNVVGLTLLIITLGVAGAPVAELRGHTGREVLILLLSGFIGIAVADTLFFYALNQVGVGIQSIVDCLYSPLVILFAWLLLQERLTISDYIGATFVLSGVAISTRHQVPPDRTRRQLVKGILVGGSAMALMAGAIVMAKPVLSGVEVAGQPKSEGFPLIWATMLRMIAGTLPLLGWGWLTRRRALVAAFRPSAAWKFALPASVLGAYVSMILWIAGFKYAQAGKAAVLNQTSSIIAILLAAIFLKEQLTRRKMLAITLSMIGVVIVCIRRFGPRATLEVLSRGL